MIQDTSYRQVIAPPAMPLDLRDTAFGGRIHEVDPAAVARLKAILAEKAETTVVKKQKTAVYAKPQIEGSGFNNRPLAKSAPEPKQEYVMSTKNGLSDDQARALHARYLAGEKPGDLAVECGLANRHTLQARWQGLGLLSKTAAGLAKRRQARHLSVNKSG